MFVKESFNGVTLVLISVFKLNIFNSIKVVISRLIQSFHKYFRHF